MEWKITLNAGVFAFVFLASQAMPSAAQMRPGIAIGEPLDAMRQIESQKGGWACYNESLDYAYLVRKGYVQLCEGRLHADMRKLRESAMTFELACEVIPSEGSAHFLAGEAYVRLGAYGKAARHLLLVSVDSAVYGRAQLRLASALARMTMAKVTTTSIGGEERHNVSSSILLLEDGASATQDDRKRWLSDAGRALAVAKDELGEEPEIFYIQAIIELAASELGIESEFGGSATTAFQGYLARVKVDEWNWRRVEFALSTVKKVDPKPIRADLTDNLAKARHFVDALEQMRLTSTSSESDYPRLAVSFLLNIDPALAFVDIIEISGPELRASFVVKDREKFVALMSTAHARTAIQSLIILNPAGDEHRATVQGRVAPTVPTAQSRMLWKDGMEAEVRQAVTAEMVDRGYQSPATKVEVINTVPSLMAVEGSITLRNASAASVIGLMEVFKSAWDSVPTICSEMRIVRREKGYGVQYSLRAFFLSETPKPLEFLN